MSLIFDKARSWMLKITTPDSLDRYEGRGWMSIPRLRNNVNPTALIFSKSDTRAKLRISPPNDIICTCKRLAREKQTKVDLVNPNSYKIHKPYIQTCQKSSTKRDLSSILTVEITLVCIYPTHLNGVSPN